MLLNRGSAADYDAWEALGNPGWGWEGLYPYFIKVCITREGREWKRKELTCFPSRVKPSTNQTLRRLRNSTSPGAPSPMVPDPSMSLSPPSSGPASVRALFVSHLERKWKEENEGKVRAQIELTITSTEIQRQALIEAGAEAPIDGSGVSPATHAPTLPTSAQLTNCTKKIGRRLRSNLVPNRPRQLNSHTLLRRQRLLGPSQGPTRSQSPDGLARR